MLKLKTTLVAWSQVHEYMQKWKGVALYRMQEMGVSLKITSEGIVEVFWWKQATELSSDTKSCQVKESQFLTVFKTNLRGWDIEDTFLSTKFNTGS